MAIRNHSQADDLRARFKVPEWGVFCHTARLRNRLPTSTEFNLTVPSYSFPSSLLNLFKTYIKVVGLVYFPQNCQHDVKATLERDVMSKFIIAPHMRLHEWIAVEKGYFVEVGLAYELEDQLLSATGDRHDLGDRVGAYQTFEKGRTCDVSSACHWTVNVAAAAVAWLLAHPSKIVPVLGTNNLNRIKKLGSALNICINRETWFEIYTCAIGQEVA